MAFKRVVCTSFRCGTELRKRGVRVSQLKSLHRHSYRNPLLIRQFSSFPKSEDPPEAIVEEVKDESSSNENVTASASTGSTEEVISAATTEASEATETQEPEEPLNIPESHEKQTGATHSHEFQAETQQLLDIVSKAIYTDKEVFLRELISNSSDALEKCRYLMSTNREVISCDHGLEIHIQTDPEKNTISIQDFGIGMNADELVENIGTIARSGSKAFLNKIAEAEDASKASSIIGQFGVGFYSSFMVSDNVQVFSQNASGDKSMFWKADGTGSYEMGPADGVSRGTKVLLQLNDDTKEFSDVYTVERIIKRYSNFVSFPIYLNGKKINTVGALWAEQPRTITDEQHDAFYKYIANAYDTPMCKLHFRADVPLSIQALFYVPERHSERFGGGRMEPGVSVYSRKVLIQPKSKEILPEWLRFVKGVVDSEDIPLHISRENMQDSALIKRINTTLVRRLILFFEELSKKDNEKYLRFFEEYAAFIKEGMITDHENKSIIAKLLRYSSSHDASAFTSLDEYIARAPPSQKNIYYLVVPNRESALNSPYYEAFARKNTEVLFLYYAIDEYVMTHLQQYEGKKLVSIESEDVSASDTNEMDWYNTEDEKYKHVLQKDQVDELADWMTKHLSHRLKSVKPTRRLEDSPAIVVGHETAPMREMLKLVDQDAKTLGKQRLEINPNHPVIRGLYYSKSEDHDLAVQCAEQVYDNALLSAGIIDDPRSILPRLNKLLAVTLDVEDIEKEHAERKRTTQPKDAEILDETDDGEKKSTKTQKSQQMDV